MAVDLTGEKQSAVSSPDTASSDVKEATASSAVDEKLVEEEDLFDLANDIFEEAEAKERVVPVEVVARIRQEEKRKRDEMMDQFSSILKEHGLMPQEESKPADEVKAPPQQNVQQEDAGEFFDWSRLFGQQQQQVQQQSAPVQQVPQQQGFTAQDMHLYNSALKERLDEDPFGTMVGMFGQLYQTVKTQEKMLEQQARKMIPHFDEIDRSAVSDAELMQIASNPEIFRSLVAMIKTGKRPPVKGGGKQTAGSQEKVTKDTKQSIMDEIYAKISGLAGSSAGMGGGAPSPAPAKKSEDLTVDPKVERFYKKLGARDKEKIAKRAKRLKELESGERTFHLEV